MTSPPAHADPVAHPTAKCPECGRVVPLQRDLDGYGRQRSNGPLRYAYHAGNRWGRPCVGNGEQHLGDES